MNKTDSARTTAPSALVLEIRHELGNALPQIQSGFRIFASGAAKNPDEAKRIHQQGVVRLLALLARLDDLRGELHEIKEATAVASQEAP